MPARFVPLHNVPDYSIFSAFPSFPSFPSFPFLSYPNMRLVWTLALLIALAVDLRQRRIPNWLTYGGILLGLLLAALHGQRALAAALMGGGLALAFFGLAHGLGRRWNDAEGASALGLGDVKLATLIGVILGWPMALPALFLALLAGGLAALAVILSQLARRAYRPGAAMPYGPYLVLGGLAGLWAPSAWLLIAVCASKASMIAFISASARSGELANCSLLLVAACRMRVSFSSSLPISTPFT